MVRELLRSIGQWNHGRFDLQHQVRKTNRLVLRRIRCFGISDGGMSIQCFSKEACYNEQHF